jgi:hypothetical protein
VDIGIDEMFSGFSKPEDLIGHVFEDEGFMSTTCSKAVAGRFSGSGVVLSIDVPKGAHGIYIPAAIDDTFDGEQELLLPRQAKLAVYGVETQKAWFGSRSEATIIKMRMVE